MCCEFIYNIYLICLYFWRKFLIFIRWYMYRSPVSSLYKNFSFKIYHKSTNSKARRGIISTPHGDIQTPAFIFCATKGSMKSTSMDRMEQNETQIILSNTYHLFLKGTKTIKELGGLHRALGWNKPMLTDSGGYQVFAMNHQGVGSDIKGSRTQTFKPTLISVTEKSAKFRCYYTEKVVELSPEISIQTQLDLGADFVVVFDECTSSTITKKETEESTYRSHVWEKRSLDYFRKNNKNQALYGIIQGGTYKDLRKLSCEFNNKHDFFGTAVGGCLGTSSEEMYDTVVYTMAQLRKDRPVHLLGIGYIRDIFHGVRQGIDTFDCVHPTRIARRHWCYVPSKYHKTEKESKSNCIDLSRTCFKDDHFPIDKDCKCTTCSKYKRSYIHYLIKAGEQEAIRLITDHNVFFFNRMFSDIRESILMETLDETEKFYVS